MRIIYAAIMFACSVLAFYYASRILYGNNRKKDTFKILTKISFASAIWSLGYSIMFLTENDGLFMMARALGMLGIILYIIGGQFIIGTVTKTNDWLRYIIMSEGAVGVIIYLIIINPKSFVMYHTDRGIITEFTAGWISILYTLYVVCIAVVFALLIAMMLKTKSNQVKAIGRTFMRMEILIFIGMIEDTLMPAIGINFNIPASTILQFFGLQLFYYALHVYDRNQINLQNMVMYMYRSVGIPIFVFDENNKLCIANNTAMKLIDLYDEELFVDADIWHDTFFHEPPYEGVEEPTQMTMDVVIGGPYNGFFQLMIDPIYDQYNDYLGYIVTGSDMSEHLKVLELGESTELKTQFLANMSHEIRTPLNAILGFNDAILQDPRDPSKVNNYALSIHEAGDSLKAIINSILDISKIEMGQLTIDSKEYNVAKMLYEIVDMFEMLAAKKGLGFEVDVDSNVPEVVIGDENHLRQVIMNLMSNAVKYTDKGKVSLTVKSLGTDPSNKMATLHFSVKDTGRGIREEDKEKLFEKFQRLDTEHFKHTEGTGLGMSIVLYTLKAMGSEIAFDSVYGEGSTFYFDIGQVSLSDKVIGDFVERRKAAAIENRMFNSFRAPDATVLIVDDVQMNIDATRALMEFSNMKIDSASSGKEALEKVQNVRYDIIFMDHMMPEMDGIQTAERIREFSVTYNDLYYAQVPIVALTANAMVGADQLYTDAGMQDYVSKPIEVNEMVRALKKWLPAEKVQVATSEEMQEETFVSEKWNIDMPGFDLEEAKKYNPSFEGFEKNLQSFERIYDSNRAEIAGFYEAGDVANYTTKVHALKSTSKMIGDMVLSEKARQAEEAGKAGNMEEATYKEVLRLYDECIRRIREYFGEADAEEQGVQLSEEDYQNILERIRNAAENFDTMEFMTLEEELAGASVPEAHKEQFETLYKGLLKVDFSAVLEAL